MSAAQLQDTYVRLLETHAQSQLKECERMLSEASCTDRHKHRSVTEAASQLTSLVGKLHALSVGLKDEAEMSSLTLRELARSCLKGVLDVTFIKEAMLEEANFGVAELAKGIGGLEVTGAAKDSSKQPTSEQKSTCSFSELLRELDTVPTALASAFARLRGSVGDSWGDNETKERAVQDGELCDLFGEEMTEVIHWRKGALVYMLASVLNEEAGDKTSRSNLLTPAKLEQGVAELIAMRQVRKSWCEEEPPPASTATNLRHSEQQAIAQSFNLGSSAKDTSDGHKEVAYLLSNGIYSQIHLLAAMYCGEMCFWRVKLAAASGGSGHDFDSEVFDNYKKIAIAQLSLYCKTIKRVPSLGDWSTDEAKALLKQLFEIEMKRH